MGINNDPPRNLCPNPSPTRRGEQELKEEIENAVRSAISKEHGLNVYDLQLIKTGSIAKTSSGQIQRYLCKEKYLAEDRREQNYGSEELKELLPILATGRELAAFAITEKGAGSNPLIITSRAIVTYENAWNIQGEKI